MKRCVVLSPLPIHCRSLRLARVRAEIIGPTVIWTWRSFLLTMTRNCVGACPILSFAGST